MIWLLALRSHIFVTVIHISRTAVHDEVFQCICKCSAALSIVDCWASS